MFYKIILLIIFAIAIGGKNICEAQSIKPYFSCSKKIEHPYGLCSHFEFKGNQWNDSTLTRQAKLMREAGCNLVRLGLFRKDIYEKQTGIFDRTFNILDRNKIEILPIAYDFRLIPNDNKWHPEIKDFDNLIEIFDKYYARKLHYIEMHNEVNFSNLKGLGQHYIEDLKELYKLKKKNRKLKILFSGIADSHYDFLDSTMVNGAYKYFDIMNVHTYRTPEDIPTVLGIIHSYMEKYKWNKPIWITECGFHTAISKNGSVAEREAKEEEQAKRIARIYLISFAYGVDKVFIYELPSPEKNPNYSEDNYGIIHKDFSPKPAYYAYKTLTKMMPNGSSRPKLIVEENVYRAEWKRPDGKQILAIWRRSGETYENIDVNQYQAFNLLGNIISINNNKVKITNGVIYLIKKN